MSNGTFSADGTDSVRDVGTTNKTGGFLTLFAEGTWGSGTLKVQASPDGSTWFDVMDATLISDGYVSFQITSLKIRLDLSGSTSPAINWWIV